MNDSLGGIETLFSLLLRAAWCAGILLVFVWILDRAGRKWFSPRVRYALWLLVAARLVMLWTPASSLSLVGQVEDAARFVSSFPRASVEAPLDVTPPRLVSDLPYSEIEPAMMLDATEWESAELSAPRETFWSTWTVWTVFAAAWGVGATLFAMKLLVDFWRLRAAMRKMELVQSGEALNLLGKIEEEIFCTRTWFALRTAGQASSGTPKPTHRDNQRRRLRLLVCERLASPAVTGVFRPALLLPRIFLDQLTLTELEHVFRHELTHVKRRDVLVNWILSWLGAVYWFFPLMRYLLSQLRKTRELACDAAVLAKASAAERAAYGKTLVRVLEMAAVGDRPVLTFTVGVAGMVWPMGNSRRESRMMRERLELVVGGRSAGKIALAIAIAVLGLLFVAGFTEGQEKKEEGNTAGSVVAVALAVKDADRESEYLFVNPEYDFTATRKLFESHQILRLAPWRMARSGALQSLSEKPIAGIGEHELGAQAAMREWVERVVTESGWSEPVETRISWYGDNKATIVHSKRSYERLERALNALHAMPESQMVLELRVNSLSSVDFAKLELSGLRAVRTDLGALAADREGRKARVGNASETVSRRISGQNFLVSDELMHRIYPKLCELPSYRCLQAPKLTLLNGQSGELIFGTTHPFVTKQEPIGKDAEQPLVDVLFRGVQSEMQAIALGEKQAWVRWDFQKSDLMEVEKAKQIGSEETVQAPKLWKISQSVGVELAAGETVAMFMKLAQPQEDKRDVLAVFLTLREIYVPKQEVESKVAPVKTTATESDARTEVFDVSRMLTLHWFASRMKGDEQLRAKLIAPAFEQLEILIKETIDPESPKTFKQSPEKLTLEVTASQEVLEKVGDLIKQLVRLADEEDPSMTLSYDVSGLPCFGGIDATNASRNELMKPQITEALGTLVKILDREIRRSDATRYVEMQPFLIDPTLTIYVSASRKQHVEVEELLKRLKTMSLAEFEKLAQIKEVREPTKQTTTPAGEEPKPQSAAQTAKKLKQERVAIPFAHLIFFSSTTPIDNKSTGIESRLIKSELQRVINLFKEMNPEFATPESGRTIEVNYADSTIVFSGPMTPQQRATVHEFYYFMKQKVADAKEGATLEGSRPQDAMAANTTGDGTERRSNEADDRCIGWVYHVDSIPLFHKIAPIVKAGQTPDEAMMVAAFKPLETIIKSTIPCFVEKQKGVDVRLLLPHLSIAVHAPLEDQNKVAELLKRLSAMSLEDCEKEAKKASGRPVHVDASKMETQDPLLLNELRKGVEFNPPKYGKASTTSRETSEESRPSGKDSSPEDQAIYKALQQRIEVRFTDKPLSEVLKLFGETTKINIVPDIAAFVEEGITVNEPVSLDLRQPVSMRSALRLILDPLNLGFMVKNEALIITSKRLTHGKRTSVAYDVAGLPFFKDFKPYPKNQEEPDKLAIEGAFERLQTIIKNAIPAFKDEKNPAEIQPFHTNLTLVISATVEDQEKVADLLKQLERMSLEDAEKVAKGAPTSTVEALRTPSVIPPNDQQKLMKVIERQAHTNRVKLAEEAEPRPR